MGGFAPGTPEELLCTRRGLELRRDTVTTPAALHVPTSLGRPVRTPMSTQAALGRLLTDLVRDAPDVAARVVTCSPDVASSPRPHPRRGSHRPGRARSRRRQALAGGYQLTAHPADQDDVTLVGVGAIMPEVITAARTLTEHGVTAGVVCLTSPDLIFRSLQQRGGAARNRHHDRDRDRHRRGTAQTRPAPLVTVQDRHPHTLAFLAASAATGSAASA